MKDAVDQALQDLAAFAAGSWSNHAIVERIEALRVLRNAEIAEAAAQARHAKAMRDEACTVLGITPGAFAGLAVTQKEDKCKSAS
jgi:hypothetical protein